MCMESRKMVLMKLHCRAAVETQTQRMDLWTQLVEGEAGMKGESSMEMYTLPYVK